MKKNCDLTPMEPVLKKVTECQRKLFLSFLLFAMSMAACLLVEKTIGGDSLARTMFQIAIASALLIAGLIAVSDKLVSLAFLAKGLGLSFLKTTWLVMTKQYSTIEYTLMSNIQQAPEEERGLVEIEINQFLRRLGVPHSPQFIKVVRDENPESL